MSKKCYSTSNENFNEQDLDVAVERLWDEGGLEVGDVGTLFVGDIEELTASHCLPTISDLLEESASDKVGEYADSWKFTKIQSESLQIAMEEALEKWIKENDMTPTFYSVSNVKEIKVKFTNENCGYELVIDHVLTPRPLIEVEADILQISPEELMLKRGITP